MKRLTTGEAARFLSVAPRTVMKWCDSGKLAHIREDGTNNRLVGPDDLKRFMEEYLMEPPAELLELCDKHDRGV